jgi:tetratricopeptide (TPR) repeat protein
MTTGMSAQELKQEGLRLFAEGLNEEAGAMFRQAQVLFAAEGNQLEAAEMLNNLGLVHRVQHRYDEAREALEAARGAFVRLGDRGREAQALGNLGGLYATLGDYATAKELLRQAATIFEELGDDQHRAETLLALGGILWKTGERTEGLVTYETGLQCLKKPTLSQKTLRGLLALRSRLIR